MELGAETVNRRLAGGTGAPGDGDRLSLGIVLFAFSQAAAKEIGTIIFFEGQFQDVARMKNVCTGIKSGRMS